MKCDFRTLFSKFATAWLEGLHHPRFLSVLHCHALSHEFSSAVLWKPDLFHMMTLVDFWLMCCQSRFAGTALNSQMPRVLLEQQWA
jgi:hypothetical protein